MPAKVKQTISAPAAGAAEKYEFRPCFRSPLDPAVVIARIRWLKEQLGRYPEGEDVLADARPVGSPLHDHFEWDDATCGEKHRLGQAVELINAIRITVVLKSAGGPRVKKLKPAFVRLRNAAGRKSFVPTDVAVVPPHREQTLAEIIQRYHHMAFRDRELGLTELAPLFAMIDQLRATYG